MARIPSANIPRTSFFFMGTSSESIDAASSFAARIRPRMIHAYHACELRVRGSVSGVYPSLPYRVNVATATSERVGGLSGCLFTRETSYYERFAPPSASANASLVLFEVNGDCTGENRDLNHELFAIDRRVAPSIRISGGSGPTIVSWDVESGPTSYDVIRGDRASLAFRGDGSVDLGSVTCLENDSLDATTAQAPDAVLPAPGEVFFYLYRGAPGTAAYGVSSSGGARLPSSGDCGP
jgi:hypothetical protein